MFEMQSVIPFTETGAGGELKLHEAVAMMMDCCQFQEYQESGFRKFLDERNLAVFLFSIQIDIVRFPRFREKVKTAVKIYGCRSICGLRRITMRDEAGKICLISNATGAFFDRTAQKAIKLSEEDLCVKFDEAEPMECLPRKIPLPAVEGEMLPAFHVGASQLDPNGHLTTPAIVAAARDALPENFTFNRMRMEFKEQAKPGEKITPVRYVTPDAVTVEIRGESVLPCTLAEFTRAELPEYY